MFFLQVGAEMFCRQSGYPMQVNALALTVAALIAAVSVHAQPGYRKIDPKPLPIHAWIGPPAAETTPARYKELRAAGFTHSMSGFPDADVMAAALDVAQAAGVKLFVNCSELHADPEGTVKRFMNHPALAGYHLRDEPDAAAFPELGEWVKRIRAVDDAHFCYINLFPNYATPEQLGSPTYDAHVKAFVKQVPVQTLSFDHYPVTVDGVRPEWYENLDIISREARNAGKPFWAFVLAVAHGSYPIPTPAHLRLQAWTNLAYGAQGIQYFTYWTPTGTRWNFHEGPIRADGTKSPVYELVTAMNEEIQAVSGVFNGAKVVSVMHTGKTIPRGTTRFTPADPFYTIETDGLGAVISILDNGSSRYIVAVNRDIEAPMSITAVIDPGAGVKRVYKDGTIRPFATSRMTETVEPGDMIIYMWNN